MEPTQPLELLTQNYADLAEEHSLLLEQAVEKVVLFAQWVGGTPEEILSLLDSGMSVTELLVFLASKRPELPR
ncbi:MAG: hypothetical protein ABSF15_08530 [Candidatus Sulfotelmatobacter sp.]|jgi:hypothetical protein